MEGRNVLTADASTHRIVRLATGSMEKAYRTRAAAATSAEQRPGRRRAASAATSRKRDQVSGPTATSRTLESARNMVVRA
jgi:hypothetical protein